MFDDGATVTSQSAASAQPTGNDQEKTAKPARKAAWADDDSDDEESEIDLTRQSRRRKLRQNDDETTISKDDYSDRLRTQYAAPLCFVLAAHVSPRTRLAGFHRAS